MAVTYEWRIDQMDAHIQSEGKDNVIYTVYYRYTGSEESDGQIYLSTIIGTESYTYTEGQSFTPYEDTEAFENIVIGWLQSSLNIEQMQATITADIKSQITPVNEELYFTWQNVNPETEE